MNRKKWIIGVVSIILIIASTIYIVKDDKKENIETFKINLYFFNENASTIVAEERDIQYKNTKTMSETVIEELINGPKDSKNKSIFNKDVELLSVEVHKNDAIVDFSKEFISDDKAKNLLATYAVVKSLCQVNGINSVKVTVCGEEILSPDQNSIGFLSDEDIDLVTDTMTKDSKQIALYFQDKNSNILLRETRVIKITDTAPIEQYVVNELIKGTQSEKAKNIISLDTQLISAQTTDNTCFINFKSGFVEKNTGNPEMENLVIYSIVNSLCEIDGVQSVSFLVDGKKIEKFGSINLTKIFTEDKDIVK